MSRLGSHGKGDSARLRSQSSARSSSANGRSGNTATGRTHTRSDGMSSRLSS